MDQVNSAAEFFDRVAPTYDQSIQGGPLLPYLDALKWRLLRQVLPSEAGSSILELGGGTGYWTIPLARLGHQITMVDVSSNMLAITEKKVRAEGLESNVRLHCGDMADLDGLPAGSFSLVLTTGGSLNYCSHIRRAIRQMKRLCKPDGYIYLNSASRSAHLADLLLNRDFNAVSELVQNGTFHESFQGSRVRRHEFEIKELLALLWEERLTVLTVMGRSTLLGILGREGLLKLLEEGETDRLLEMEEYLSQNEYLISQALQFEVICQVG
ncbi:MAG: class I SAM-dependent methyltransferase [Chloroflexota bacterium]